MKKLQQFGITVVLSLIVATSAYAGDIYIGKTPPPPPDPSAAAAAGDIATPGDIHLPGAPSNSVTDTALNLLQTLLTVF